MLMCTALWPAEDGPNGSKEFRGSSFLIYGRSPASSACYWVSCVLCMYLIRSRFKLLFVLLKCKNVNIIIITGTCNMPVHVTAVEESHP